MEHTNQEFRQAPPKREKKFIVFWIILGVVVCAALAAGIWLELYVRKPKVHNAQEAAAYLAEKAENLGYANALSELTEVYSQNVDGDSYYRLQQNYNGIPVYGRTVVYVTDEDGRNLSVSQNVRDIPEGMELTPSVTEEQVLASLTEYFGEEVPEMPLFEDDLCIYAFNNSTVLAYRLNIGAVEILVDAHSGGILHCRNIYSEETEIAIVGDSGKVIRALVGDNGNYVMKDTDENIYVFDAEHKVFYDMDSTLNKFRQTSLTLVESPNQRFGDDDDNTAGSWVAADALGVVLDIRDFWRNGLGGPDYPYEMILVVNDNLNVTNTRNAAGGVIYNQSWVSHYLPENQLDLFSKNVAVLSIGEGYSNTIETSVDTIAHEYGHLISHAYVGWTGGRNYENRGLDEAFSDIFATLAQAYVDETMVPTWQQSTYRNLADPRSSGQAAHVGDLGSTTDIYSYSTVISHAAYLMWTDDPRQNPDHLTTQELSQLWYRTVLTMPSNADFVTCRNVMETAARHMGLSRGKQQTVSDAFTQVGIVSPAQQGNADYVLDEKFKLSVMNSDLNYILRWSVVIRDYDASSGVIDLDNEPITFSTIDSGTHRFDLEPGYYKFTLTTQGSTADVVEFTAYVDDEAGGDKYLNIMAGDTPEFIPPNTEPAATEPGETDPAPTKAPVEETTEGYRIVRWDRSARNEDGSSGMDYWFDYVVLEGDSEAIRKINEYIYADAEVYMTKISDPSATMRDPANNTFIGYCIAESHVTFFENGLLSINVNTDEYLGGNTSHADSYGLFFNLNTGEKAALVDLTGLDEQTLLPLLQDICWATLETYDYMLMDNAHATLMGMDLEDYDFYVRDGEIIIHFPKYQMTAGVVGAVYVPTGLRIGADNAPGSPEGSQESVEKVTLGNEGPVTAEEVFLDRWDNKLNKMGHENAQIDVTYLVLSGNGAVDAINQDLYRIAEDFVNTYPREEVEQFHYAFGMPYHFIHHAYMELGHIGDGIVTVNMTYYGFWGEDNTYAHNGTSNSCSYTYSLSTGEQLSLSQLTGLSEEELLPLLKKGIDQWLEKANQGTFLNDKVFTEETEAFLENVSSSDFGVYVTKEGQIGVTLNRIHLRKTDGSRGYWVTIEFPLDCYIN